MYRTKQNTIHVNVNLESGIGDQIAALPAVKYVYDHHPHVVQHVWLADFLKDFAVNTLPKDKQRLIVRGYSQREKYNQGFYTRVLGGHVHTSLGTHLVDYAFNVLVNQQVGLEHKNYLPLTLEKINIDKFNLPEKFVVVTTGFTASVRELLPKHINEISKYLLKKGYTPVFLGKEQTATGYEKDAIIGQFKEEIDYSVGVNLINKTNLLEAAKVISQAKAIVGLDNGLLHVAGGTDTPIVAGYSNVKPETRMPYRHDQLGWNCYPVTLTPQELACIGCQTLWQFTYHHTFTECFYGDRKCLDLISSERYIEELNKLL